jgi:hypothetical protein
MEIEASVATGLGRGHYKEDVEIHDCRGRWWTVVYDHARVVKSVHVQNGDAPFTALAIIHGHVKSYIHHLGTPLKLVRMEMISLLSFQDDGAHFVVLDNALEQKGDGHG